MGQLIGYIPPIPYPFRTYSVPILTKKHKEMTPPYTALIPSKEAQRNNHKENTKK